MLKIDVMYVNNRDLGWDVWNYVKCIYVNMCVVVVSGGLVFFIFLIYFYEDLVFSVVYDSIYIGVY